MKEATGELNMTVVTIIAIGAVVAFFWFLWPQISETVTNQWNDISEGQTNNDSCGPQQYWDGSKCVSRTTN